MNIEKEVYDLWDRPSNIELESGKYVFINIDKNKEEISTNINNLVDIITSKYEYVFFYSPTFDKIFQRENIKSNTMDNNDNFYKPVSPSNKLYEEKVKPVREELNRKLIVKIMNEKNIKKRFFKKWVDIHFNENNPRKPQKSFGQCFSSDKGIYSYSFSI